MDMEEDILNEALSDLDDILDDALDEIDKNDEKKFQVWQDTLNFLPIAEKLKIVKQIEKDVQIQANTQYGKRIFSSTYKRKSFRSYIDDECENICSQDLCSKDIFSMLLEKCPSSPKQFGSLYEKNDLAKLFCNQLKHDIQRKLNSNESDLANISLDGNRFLLSKTLLKK